MQETGVQPDKATCNILVEQCSKAGEAWAIIQILHYMKDNSLVLRYPIYLLADETLKMAGETDFLLRQVNPHISVNYDNAEPMGSKETTYDMNKRVDGGLLITFLRNKNFVAFDRLFAGMVQQNLLLAPDLASKIITLNCTSGRIQAAFLVLEYCNRMGIRIEKESFLSLIGFVLRMKDLSKIIPLVEQMIKLDLFPEPEFAALLIYRLGQAKELDTAVKVFSLFSDEMKTTTLYTALISACFSAGDPDKGIETFKSMKIRGISGTLRTYDLIIRGLEMSGRVDEVKHYRKEKKSLQRKDGISKAFVMDEKICDALFAGYLLP